MVAFPLTPNVGDRVTGPNGQVWQWDGAKWMAVGPDAPVYALRDENLILNGAFWVNQVYGTGNVNLANGAWFSDQWQVVMTGSPTGGNFTSSQVSSSVPDGFPTVGYIASQTPAPISAAGDSFTIQQPIEGNRWARLAWGQSSALGRPVTVSFWCLPSITGNMALSVRNRGTTPGNPDLSYVVDVPLTGGVWNWRSVVIPAPGIIAGRTWNTDINVGAWIGLCFGGGANGQIAPNTWVQANGYATANTATNFFSTASSVRLAGLSVLPGNVPLSNVASIPALAALMMRDPQRDLWECYRYLQTGVTGTLRGQVSGASQSIATPVYFRRPMRTGPTITTTAQGSYANVTTLANVLTALTVDMGHFQVTSQAAGDMYAMGVAFTLDARMPS